MKTGIYILLFATLIIGCDLKSGSSMRQQAQKSADYLLEHLNDAEAYSLLPDKFFKTADKQFIV